jgi:hypothetical protein
MQQLHHTVELVSLSGSRLTSARRGRGARRQGDADGGVQSRDSQNSRVSRSRTVERAVGENAFSVRCAREQWSRWLKNVLLWISRYAPR